jgi:hypothetical protein
VLPNGTTIEYVIDGERHRIGKKVNGTLVKAWLYEDSLRIVAELDGSGAVVSHAPFDPQAEGGPQRDPSGEPAPAAAEDLRRAEAPPLFSRRERGGGRRMTFHDSPEAKSPSAAEKTCYPPRRRRRALMRRLEHLLEEAKRLPYEDRRRLIEQLEALGTEEEETEGEEKVGRYSHTLGLAGTMHSDATDVSSDKYRHLADVYADDHDEEP